MIPELAQINIAAWHWGACIVTLCMISSARRALKEEVTSKNFYLLGISRNSMSALFRLQSCKTLSYYWCCSILCSQMKVSKECHKPIAQAERRNRKLQSLSCCNIIVLSTAAITLLCLEGLRHTSTMVNQSSSQ